MMRVLSPLGSSLMVAWYARNGRPLTATYEKYSPLFQPTMCSSTVLPSSKLILLAAPFPVLFLDMPDVPLTPVTHERSVIREILDHAFWQVAFTVTALLAVPVWNPLSAANPDTESGLTLKFQAGSTHLILQAVPYRMVFGWGKKEPETPATAHVEREITLGAIEKILGDLDAVRSRTLIAEAVSFRDRVAVQLGEIGQIAVQLEKDNLKINDIDKHIKTIVERGKKQVIATIKEEVSGQLSEIASIEDVLSLNGRINRSLKRIGDVLGRQTKVIHLFAKKYAGRLKTTLSDLQKDKDAIQVLIDNYKTLERGISEINENMALLKKSKESLEKKSKRIGVFRDSLKELGDQAGRIRLDIEKIKGSGEYLEFLKIRGRLDALAPEKLGLRREINDQFTKISRPLGKYEYVSSLDKEQKSLLRILVSDPFLALSHDRKNSIIIILQSVKKGVISGSVSVKDVDKSTQFLDETTELLDSLIQQKAAFSEREAGLRKQLDSFDMGAYRDKQHDLEKTGGNCESMTSKIREFEDEITDTKKLIPKLVVFIEQRLRELTSTRYVLRDENS